MPRKHIVGLGTGKIVCMPVTMHMMVVVRVANGGRRVVTGSSGIGARTAGGAGAPVSWWGSRPVTGTSGIGVRAAGIGTGAPVTCGGGRVASAIPNGAAGPRVVRRGGCCTGGLEYGRRICVEHGARGVERERSPLGREIDPVTHARPGIIAEPIHKGSTGVAPPIGTDVGDEVGIWIHDPHVHLYIDRIDIAAGSIRSTRARPKMVVVAARRRIKGRAAVGIRGNRH